MNKEFKEIMDIVKANGEMYGRIEAVKAYVRHSKYSVDNDAVLAMLGEVTNTMITDEIKNLEKAMKDAGVCVAFGDLEDGILGAVFGNIVADDEKEEAQYINTGVDKADTDKCDGDCNDCDCDCEQSCYDCLSSAEKEAKPKQATCDCKLPRGCEDCCPDDGYCVHDDGVPVRKEDKEV